MYVCIHTHIHIHTNMPLDYIHHTNFCTIYIGRKGLWRSLHAARSGRVCTKNLFRLLSPILQTQIKVQLNVSVVFFFHVLLTCSLYVMSLDCCTYACMCSLYWNLFRLLSPILQTQIMVLSIFLCFFSRGFDMLFVCN
jgi:hypothetical protein